MDFELTLKDLRAFFAQSNWCEAERLALLLKQHHPKRVAGYNALTSIYAESKNAGKAWVAGKEAFELFPKDINAILNYANLLIEREATDKAIEILNVANQAHSSAAICFRIAQLELSKGIFDKAVEAFSSGIDLDPRNRTGWLGLVAALTAGGRYREVLQKCHAFQELFGFSLEIECNKGLALFYTDQLDEANFVFERVLKRNPRYVPALLNKGAVAQQLGDFDVAIDSFSNCIDIDQSNVEAYINLSVSFAGKGFKKDAIETLRDACQRGLGYYEVFYELGNLLHECGEFNDAFDAYQKGIESGNVEREIYNNLAVTLKYLGDLEGAKNYLRKALQMDSSYPEAHYNLGLVLWACKEFSSAFRHYEYRFNAIKGIGKAFTSAKPIWNGSSRENVFVWREQGLGDEIFFSSSLTELRGEVASLTVEIDPRLITLFKRSFPNDIKFIANRFGVGSNSFDSHISLGSQFGMFRQELRQFDMQADGYLVPDAHIVSWIRGVLNRSCEGLRVGISWSTKSIQTFAHFREVDLVDLVEALSVPRVQLVSLQYGDVASELEDLEKSRGVKVVRMSEVDNSNDLEGLAALISNMDLVVSIDNVTVNLAGALGINTAVLLPFTPDPRWSANGEQSYVYRSVKLYRQSVRGNWQEVLNRLRVDVLAWSNQLHLN